MKTQLKILAFTLATFNLTQAAEVSTYVINEEIRKSSTAQIAEPSDKKTNASFTSFSSVAVDKVKPRDSRCGYLMSYFKSIPSIYNLPSTLSVYASDVYKSVSEKAQVVYNSTAKNIAYYTKAAREKVWGTSGRRIIKEEQAEAEIAEKRDAVKEEDKKEAEKVEKSRQQEVVEKKKANPQQAEADAARKKAAVKEAIRREEAHRKTQVKKGVVPEKSVHDRYAAAKEEMLRKTKLVEGWE